MRFWRRLSAIRILCPVTSAEDSLAQLREGGNRGLAKTLGIELTELSPDKVVATMPVDERTRQPFGILHGGASVALSETVASIAALLNIDRATQVAMGIEINANHIRAKSEGTVTGTATPIHRGRTTQVWDVRIVDEENRPVCISRCTIAVVQRQRASEPIDSK
jgi:uncharacterized protein (TIGR00369 family)